MFAWLIANKTASDFARTRAALGRLSINAISPTKSGAISVTNQSQEKALEDADLDQINRLIIETVENKTGAKIRS